MVYFAYDQSLSGVGKLPVLFIDVVQETQVRSLGQEDPLEEGITTHSSILAWKLS